MILLVGHKKELSLQDTISQTLRLQRRLGQFFAQARLSLDLSARDLDALLGFSPGQYETWENGFQLPSPQHLNLLWPHLGRTAATDFLRLFNQLSGEAQTLTQEVRGPQIG